jgi:hypothetical protein
MTHSWFPWRRRGSARRAARRQPAGPTKTRRSSRPRGCFVPQLLVLEDRTLLSVLTVLSNADSGAGSLRATIEAAQSGDTIVFDPSLMDQTITLSSGPLTLSSNLTIDGLGADQLAISGNYASQLFTLSGTAQVTLANLTVTGGISDQGGAVFIGGSASLTLDGDILSDNQAAGDTHGNAFGGAVYNSAGASLTIANTAFVNNQTNGTKESFGGAIANAGTLAITGATFTGNAALGSTTPIALQPGASQGGAIGNLDGSTSTITLSAFTGNQAVGNGAGDAQGGAICNEDADLFPFTGRGVTTTLSQCTFQNNVATVRNDATFGAFGGAIGNNPGVELAVLNSSFTSNQAKSNGSEQAVGGAISTGRFVHGDDTVTISDSQFIGNSALGSDVGGDAVAGAVENSHTMTIANSLFTGNSAVAGGMPEDMDTPGQALGGALQTGEGIFNGRTVILTISNSIIAGNAALGGSGGSTLASAAIGIAAGGGIINLNGGTLNVAGCTITGNEAIGGASAMGSGGAAFGGGLENNNQCTLNLTNSTVSTNLCQGGAGASGSAGGIASGGGLGNDHSAIAIITNCTLSLNESLGGVGGTGANGGAGVGGGIANAVYAFAFAATDASSLTVSNCQIVGNVAQGGMAGSNALGGDALGGGLWVGGGTVVLERVLVSGNQAQGGVDSQNNTTGQGLGGGVYVDPSASAIEDMQTLIAGNQASKSDNDVWGTITTGP